MSRPIEFDKDWVPVRITTSIPMKFVTSCKANGWKYSEVFRIGFALMEDGGKMSKRILILEAQVQALLEYKKRVESNRTSFRK